MVFKVNKLLSFFCLQVSLEEQMICGALQTLNEEACEDVLEELEDQVGVVSLSNPNVAEQPPGDFLL